MLIIDALLDPADHGGRWYGSAEMITETSAVQPRPGHGCTGIHVYLPVHRCRPALIRVVDAQTGLGVPGVFVAIFRSDSEEPWQNDKVFLRSGPTSPDGTCVVNLPPGNYSAMLEGDFPGWMTRGGASHRVALKVASAVPESPEPAVTLKVQKPATVQVIVQDAAGHPVPGALVRPGVGIRTDIHGRATLNERDLAAPIQVTAGIAPAFAGPVTVNPATQKGPVRLTLRPATALSLSGRVVDVQGQPIPGAVVEASIQSVRMVVTGGILYGPAWSASTSVWTDARGGFLTTPTERGGRVNILVSYPGRYSVRIVRVLEGRKGVVDLGAIRLLRPTGMQAGRVLDARGKPVPAARVWALSQAPVSFTDAAGRFTLERIDRRPTFLFVRSQDRLLARPTDGSFPPLTLTLRPSGKNVPVHPASPGPSWAAIRKAALKILDIGLAATAGRKNDWSRRGLLYALAAVDPARAAAVAAREGRPRLPAALNDQAQAILATDPQKAVAVLNQMKLAPDRAEALVRLVSENILKYPKQDREIVPAAQAAIEHDLSADRALKRRIELAVDMAVLRMPEARAMINSLVQAVLKDPEHVPRGQIASALAYYDVDAALNLLPPGEDGSKAAQDRDTVLESAGPGQLDRALQIAAARPDPDRRSAIYQGLAVQAAALDPADVDRVLARMSNPWYRAQTELFVAQMAAPVAPGGLSEMIFIPQNNMPPRSDDARRWLRLARKDTHNTSWGVADRLQFMPIAVVSGALHDPEAAEDGLWALSICRVPEEPVRLVGLTRDADALDAALGALIPSDPALARQILELEPPETTRPLAGEEPEAYGLNTCVAAAWLILDPDRSVRCVREILARGGRMDVASVVQRGLAQCPRR